MSDDRNQALEAGSDGYNTKPIEFSRHQAIEPKVVTLNDLILNLDKMLSRLIEEDIELAT